MDDTLNIAVDHLNPPFSEADDFGARGFTIDLINAALAEIGMTAHYRPADGPVAQLIWLAAGRVDAAADITVTERRRAWFAFSAHYHVEELMIFGLRHGPIWPGFRHFSGRLAVKANSYVHEYLIRHHPRIPLVTVDSTETEMEELRTGRVQGFAATRETGLALITDGHASDVIPMGAPFGPAPLALAALRDDARGVVAAFDEGLTRVRQRGVIDALRARWLHAFAHA